jgi:polyisoprenoid-binding protein YceI
MGFLWIACGAAWAAVLAVAPDRGTLGFELPASLHAVSGRAPAFGGTLDTDALTGALTIDAGALTTGLGPRDSRMTWHCLEVARFPTIALAVNRIDGATEGLRAGAGSGAVTLEGTLTIRDVTRPVAILASYAWEGDALRLRGRHALAWTDWSIPDPSTLLSTVSPELTVTFDVLASPS